MHLQKMVRPWEPAFIHRFPRIAPPMLTQVNFIDPMPVYTVLSIFTGTT